MGHYSIQDTRQYDSIEKIKTRHVKTSQNCKALNEKLPYKHTSPKKYDTSKAWQKKNYIKFLEVKLIRKKL